MPTTVNGIGTHYYGRRNLFTHTDQCPHCKRTGELRSYDTTLFFAVIFVPLIPLGEKRIVNQCPSCSQHFVVPLAEWRRGRSETLAKVAAQYREDPGEETALAALDAVVSYQALNEFTRLAPVLREYMADNAMVLVHLGAAHEEFGQLPEAESVYRAALGVKIDPVVEGFLAVNLVRQGRPAEARPFVAPILKKPDPERLSLLYLLVEGYQVTGDHSEALALLKEMAAVFPDAAATKEHRKYEKASRKGQVSGRPVRHPHLMTSVRQPARESKCGTASSLVPRLIGPLVLAVLLIGYVAWAIAAARSRDVWLVNGTGHKYTAIINGTPYPVGANGWRRLSLPEGEHTVSAPNAVPPIAQQSFRVSSSMWLRPFRTLTWVLNPDRLALILWEQTLYSEHPDPDVQNPYEIRVGELLEAFSGIDYEFVEFPESITLSEGSSAKRERIACLGELNPANRITLAMQYLPESETVDYLERLCRFNPDDSVCITIYADLAPPDQFRAFVEPYLAERPLRLEWHRCYQDTIGRNTPDYDLRGKYAALVENEPGNVDLLYLLSRTVNDPQEAEHMLEQAIGGAAASAYACGSLALRRLNAGRFEEAMELAHAGTQAGMENPWLDYVLWQGRMALLDTAEIVEICAQARKQAPADPFHLQRLVQALAAQSRRDEADAEINAYCAAIATDSEPALVQQWRDFFTANYHYSAGDMDAYSALQNRLAAPGKSLRAAVVARDLEGAVAAIGENEDVSAYDNLLVGVLAALTGNGEAAAQRFDLAAEELRQGDSIERFFARTFAGELDPAPETMVRQPMGIEQKRVLLTALALRFPEKRQPLLAAAARLNYDRDFPQRLIAEAVAK